MIKKYVCILILLIHLHTYAILDTSNVSHHLENRVRILANKMNIQRPFQILNANDHYSFGNSIFIDEYELNKLPKEEQNMILCHELSHLSSYHSEKILAFVGCMSAATIANSLQLQDPHSKYKFFSFLAIQTAITTGFYYGLKTLNHSFEYEADKKAYKHLNESTGFLYLQRDPFFTDSCFTHPSSCQRLERILKYDKNNLHAKKRPQNLVPSTLNMLDQYIHKKSRD